MTLPTLPDIGTDRRPVFWMVAIVLVIGMVVPLALLWALDSEPQITLRTSSITVTHGTRSRQLTLRDVTEVALADTLPAPVDSFPALQQRRPYVGPYRTGAFLIVRRVAPPYLIVRSADRFFLIRQETEEETRNLYEQVRSAWLSQQGRQE